MNTIVVPALVTGCQFALVALGINVLVRVTGIVNFAFGNLLGMAPLAVLVGIDKFHLSLGLSLFLAGIFVVVALALVQERITLRPFLGSGSALPWILSTLAASLILTQVAQIPFNGNTLPFPYDLGEYPVKLGPFVTTWANVTVVVVTIVVYVGMLWLHSKTSVGRMLTAVSQDPMGASAIGISVSRASQMAAMLSALVAFAIGIVTAPITEVSTGATGLSVLFSGFVAATIGGIGSLEGALVGGLVTGLLIQLVTVYLGPVWINTFLFAGLILILGFRPHGLFGRVTVRAV